MLSTFINSDSTCNGHCVGNRHSTRTCAAASASIALGSMFSNFESWRFVALSVLLISACREADPSARPSRTVVRVVLPGSTEGTYGARYSARIEPMTRVDLAFKVGGYVREIAKVPANGGGARILQEGDPVTKFMRLAALQSTDYEQKLAQAKAVLASASAAREQGNLDFGRASKLYASDSISQAASDTARIRRDAANAEREAAEARASEAWTALGDTVLRSPIDGVVLKRTIEIGNLVSPGVLGFTVADVKKVKAVFGIPDTKLDYAWVGKPQRLTTEAYGTTEFQGSITRVSPAADARSRLFDVEITILNRDNRLKPGMTAALVLTGESRGESSEAHPVRPTLPVAAVVRGAKPGSFAVFALEQQGGTTVARLKQVELGEYFGRTVALNRGVALGEQIVADGASFLADGEVVQVIP
jgi:RND family efflux transporter MFP subunit